MPTWTQTVPTAHPFAGVPLLRTPQNGFLAGHILSKQLTGTYTHYAQGRTQPHEDTECIHCAAKIPYRYHAYLSILNDRNRKACVIEMTAAPAELITQWVEANAYLRGVHISLCRPRKTLNGRVAIDLRPGTLSLVELPEEIDCINFMSQMWNIAATRLNPTQRANGQPHIRVDEEQDLLPMVGIPKSLREILTERSNHGATRNDHP